MLAPANTMRPSSGAMRPVTMLKNVVLPAPLGPISPMMAPRGTTRSTSPRATTPPKRLATPRTSRIGSGAAERRALSRSHAGRAAVRRGASSIRGASSSSSDGAIGRTRRPARPSGFSSITSTSPRPKKNQRHNVTSATVSACTPVLRPTHRTKNVICASATRSKIVMSMPPRITPLMLPAPPSTTMHRSMIDTWNSNAPGVMAWSLAA